MRLLAACTAALLVGANAVAQDASERACPSPPENDAIDFGEPIEVSVVAGEETHAFTTLVADDPFETSRGMMFRPSMADDEAMFFDFSNDLPDRVHRFWMRNTCVSLDILYIRADGTVIGIVERAQPFAEILLPSPGPVRGVLEIRGGRAGELGITPGAQVLHPAFEQAEADAEG